MKRPPAKRTKQKPDATALVFNAVAFLAKYDRFVRALVVEGHHPSSPWWQAERRRLLLNRQERRGLRRWIIRAGRRAGKSSELCRLAVAWALWGPWFVPAGDIAVISFVSVSRDESA